MTVASATEKQGVRYSDLAARDAEKIAFASLDSTTDSFDPWEGALCSETDPEAFFPEKGESNREAKRICAECPLQVACLSFALTNGEEYGVWGGLSTGERKRLRRSSRRRKDTVPAAA